MDQLIAAMTLEHPHFDFVQDSSNGLWSTKCDKKSYYDFKEIEFRVDNVIYEIPRKGYVKY